MSINTLATATLFQTTLDKVATHEALTGWMEENAGQVIYEKCRGDFNRLHFEEITKKERSNPNDKK